MKSLLPMILVASVALCGCAARKNGGAAADPPPVAAAGTPSTKSSAEPTPASPKLIVTPGSEMAGKVAVYNDAGQFVVLDFPIGHVPPAEQRMFVYRGGLKVGEVKITGPQKENRTVADLVAGEARKGDDVRDK